jgi:hypothetical protein
VVFDFTADYTGVGPQTFLKDYRGYLQADALAQYEALYGVDRVKHCCCWAHARHKFVAAADGGETRAEAALERIRQLYVIEQQLPPLLSPSAAPAEQRRQREGQRQALRQLHARPVLTTLKQWLEEQRPHALPKSALGQAIGYAWNNWAALERYLEQGYLPIDNNLSERTLRVIAVGRNNWGSSAVKGVAGRRRCCSRWWGRASIWGSTPSSTCARRCRGSSRWGTSRHRSRWRGGCRIGGCRAASGTGRRDRRRRANQAPDQSVSAPACGSSVIRGLLPFAHRSLTT